MSEPRAKLGRGTKHLNIMTQKLKQLAQDATTAMEQADEILNQQMNKGENQSQASKAEKQRQSNAVFRVLQALELLNYEL